MNKLLGLVVLAGISGQPIADELQQLLDTVRSVGAEGQGNAEASAAWRQISQQDATALPTILAGLDRSSPLASNWLAAAVDSIAERTLNQGKPLPMDQLERFVLDRSHSPRARGLAFAWLREVDPTALERLIGGMLNDPNVEFRRMAVARLLEQTQQTFQGKKGQELLQRTVYRRILADARDDDQIKTIVKKLKELGEEVDLPRHFGFLMSWSVVGPFANTDREGYFKEYAPEKQLDLQASYTAVDGKVTWQPYVTDDPYGMVDLNEPFGMKKQVLAYAVSDFISDRDQQVELRLGCKNAWKLWVNGELIFARNEYHRGMRLDQYIMKVNLKQGANRILIKLCQNEQEETWTKEWQFQLRVCDGTGTAILSQDRDG